MLGNWLGLVHSVGDHNHNKIDQRQLSNNYLLVIVIVQPRSQSSWAISDVTSPVKLVGKVRRRRLANNGKSKMAAPSQECDFSQDCWRNEKKHRR